LRAFHYENKGIDIKIRGSCDPRRLSRLQSRLEMWLCIKYTAFHGGCQAFFAGKTTKIPPSFRYRKYTAYAEFLCLWHRGM